ncbi:hypothetical protein K1T71_004765 [Dendrolimus kikuchii]|uniref:Uncharacterized protein n=1 Tax=Dendrolimus kikuchii TaxID=765133 RepID=A0ACC1D8U7_9NEOP|nr:hypothetical protein K1T71_004765 [Dendrolimus kikuchii]
MASKVNVLSLILLLIISSAVSAPTDTEQVEVQKREDLSSPEKEDLKASASHWGGHLGGWGGHYGGHWGGHYGGHWPYYGSYWGWPSYGYGYWPYGGYYGHHGYWW